MGRSSCCKSRYGTTFAARHWRSLDGCGTWCILFSIGIHLYAATVLGIYFVSSHRLSSLIVFYGLYVPAAFMALWSLWVTYTTDPGAVPMGARPLDVGEGDVTAAAGGEQRTVVRSGSAVSGAAAVVAGVAAVAGAPLMSSGRRQSSADSETGAATSLLEGHEDNDDPSNRETTKPLTEAAAAKSPFALTEARTSIRRCRKCNDNYKPPRAHHDSVTGRCVVKMDHYCPWVCNAIGALNHKFFCLFIFYTFLASVFSAVLMGMRFAECGDFIGLDYIHANDYPNNSNNNKNQDDDNDDAPYYNNNENALYASPKGCPREAVPIPFATLFIITVLFFLFTFCMLLEQYHAIVDNMGKIARLKMERQRQQRRTQVGNNGHDDNDDAAIRELGRVAQDFNEMFGGTSRYPSWHWFVPLQVWFPHGMREVVLGYQYEEGVDGQSGGPWRPPPTHSGGGKSVGVALESLEVATKTRSVMGVDVTVPAADEEMGGSSLFQRRGNKDGSSPMSTGSGTNVSPTASKVPYARLENQEEEGGEV